MMLCGFFFLCPCFSLNNFFFALSKHHAYGQKENYCRNIDAPARVLFQKY